MCAVRPVQVVVGPPVLQENLGFEQGLEALAVQVLIPEPAIERFHPGVLPLAPRIDKDGVGAVEPAPVGHGISDELWPVEFLSDVKPLRRPNL